MKASSANRPIASVGLVAAKAAKVMISTTWHSRIQLLRRPIRSSPGSFTRSTIGDHRNLNE